MRHVLPESAAGKVHRLDRDDAAPAPAGMGAPEAGPDPRRKWIQAHFESPAPGSPGTRGARFGETVLRNLAAPGCIKKTNMGKYRRVNVSSGRPLEPLVEISRLARPTLLIEIEFDAVDGAKDRARRISSGRPLKSNSVIRAPF